MTNYEHYKNKIDELWSENSSVSITDNGIERCVDVKCDDCLLSSVGSCGFALQKWLVSEYKEPEKDVDWSKVPVDTPVFVKENDNNEARWFPRYFAKYENEEIFTFMSGATSWSAGINSITTWKYAKLANSEELKRRLHQESTMSKVELMNALCEEYMDTCTKSDYEDMMAQVDGFWNADISNEKKLKIANVVMELLKMEE